MGILRRQKGALSDVKEAKNKLNLNFLAGTIVKNALANDLLNEEIIDLSVQQAQIINAPIQDEQYIALYNPIKFINKYLNKETIDRAIENNPNIKRILAEFNLDTSYNIESVTSIVMSHLVPTTKMAQKIYRKLGHSINELNYLYLSQAALLHDIGKIFIPSEILNKKGKLNFKEREIIELHNKLSYELLKMTDLNPKVAQLALEHHNYENNLKRSPENQILTISDIYCALREKRPYKNPINDIGAKTILYDMGTKGKFDTKYISYI